MVSTTTHQCIRPWIWIQRMHQQTSLIFALLNIILLLVLSFDLSAQATQIQARIDRNTVSIGETFKLIFESQQTVQPPDLTPLEQDFEIINQSQSNSTQVINGRVSYRITLTVTLHPLKTGALRIPALNFGNVQSNPVPIQVTDAPAPNQIATAGEAVFLEAEILPKTAYVQQQLVYVVRVFHAVNLKRGSHLKPPRLKGVKALIEPLGEDRQYTVQRAGQEYSVIERRFAIFPQESGRLSMAPILLEAVIPDPQAQKQRNPNDPFADPFFSQWDPFNDHSKQIRQFSPAVSIDVQAPAASFSGQTWLPAQNLELKTNWSVEPHALKTGEPVTLTLALIAEGLKSEQLPPLAPTQIADMKQYSNQPNLHDQLSPSGFIGIREEKLVLMPTKPGNFTLPAIEIPWWNSQTQRQQIARIEAQKLTVTGAATTSQAQVTPHPVAPQNNSTNTRPNPIEDSATPQAANSSLATTATDVSDAFNPWIYLSILLLLLLFISLAVIIYLLRFGTTKPALNARSVKDNLSKQLQKKLTREKRLRKAAIQACEENDRHTAKQHLLTWGQHIHTQDVLSLSQLSALCEGDLAQAISALNQQLYSPKAQTWSGKSLAQALKQYTPKKQHMRTEAHPEEALSPLHKIN